MRFQTNTSSNTGWCGLKILIIHPHLSVMGGSEVLTRILAYELARLGHEVHILTSSISESFFRQTSNVKISFFEKGEHGLNNVHEKVVQICLTLARLFEKETFDTALVMIQEPIYNMLIKVVSPKTPTAIYIHYPFEEELTKENIVEFVKMFRFPGLYEKLYTIADVKIANSTYTARTLYRKFGITSYVVYPAIPWEFFREEPDLDTIPGKTIITVGRFVPHKRIDTLLHIFREKIVREVPEAKLIIIGVKDPRYSSYYMKLREIAETTENVVFIDKPLTPLEMVKYYRMARVYVHMRIGEHFGMAPVEAMSQAVIPIIPKESGLAELISDGVEGYTYITDEEALKRIIEILKTNDSESIRNVRRRCYCKAQYFNPRRFAQEILNYITFPRK